MIVTERRRSMAVGVLIGTGADRDSESPETDPESDRRFRPDVALGLDKVCEVRDERRRKEYVGRGRWSLLLQAQPRRQKVRS